ncbi:hypothetical protein [Actinocatenispora rupis]|uniref:Uncharacterized protein n=1 Tax=Actinocatenispora rupis TaxID=519421 RepID=A0A8J3NEC3_9ACTN|nr:hypothetical protein [Actinocatenispora rupis]GID16219.1 hypothetical protein Aru02nite_71080 [Actinocatenispora rupis]
MVTMERRYTITSIQDVMDITLDATRYRLDRIKDRLSLEALDGAEVVERLEIRRTSGGVRTSFWHRSGATLAYAIPNGRTMVGVSTQADGTAYPFEAPLDADTKYLATALEDVTVPPVHRIAKFGAELKTNSDLQASLTLPGVVSTFALSTTCQALCDAAAHPEVVAKFGGPAAVVAVTAACTGCLLQDLGI